MEPRGEEWVSGVGWWRLAGERGVCLALNWLNHTLAATSCLSLALPAVAGWLLCYTSCLCFQAAERGGGHAVIPLGWVQCTNTERSSLHRHVHVYTQTIREICIDIGVNWQTANEKTMLCKINFPPDLFELRLVSENGRWAHIERRKNKPLCSWCNVGIDLFLYLCARMFCVFLAKCSLR